METPLMQQIEDAGVALLQPSATVDELLNRISNLDHLLQKVEQQPSPSMQRSLITPIEALATDGLLKNVDLNVKILVGSCICEIARITAPEPPYEETKMRDVSDLLVTIIKSLSFVTGNAYRKAALVLAIVSRCHLFNAMWDCDEAFIIEMFKEFLHLQINHADNVITDMEQIMTMLLNVDAPKELFGILLNSLNKDNENLYPVSYKLAERVFLKCADMLKKRLPTAVRLSEIVPYDYSEVVARVLNAGKKLVLQDDAMKEVGPSDALPLDPLKTDEAPLESKDDTRKTIIPKETSQIVITQLNHPCHNGNVKATPELDSESCHNGNVKAASELNSESSHAQNNKESFGGSSSDAKLEDSAQASDIAAAQSVPEEFKGPVVLGTTNENLDENSMKNNSSKILWHVCDKTKGPNVSDANCPQVENSDAKTIVLEASNPERASTNTEQNMGDVETSWQQGSEKVSTRKKRGWKPNFLQKIGEGYDDLWVDSGKRSSDAASRRRNNKKDLKGPYVPVTKDSLVGSERIPNRKRSRKGKPKSAYHPLMEHEYLNSSSAHMGSRKQRNGGVKHNGEKILPKVSGIDSGEALVGSKIRLYWANDNKSYEGSIISYDIETKKYKVLYDDGGEEVQDLAREQFELLGNNIGTDRVQLSDDDTATLYDLLKNVRNARPSTKRHKFASHDKTEKVSRPNIRSLEVVNSRSNLEKGHPIDVVNPSILESPGEKMQDKTRSKSRDLKLGEVQTELVKPRSSSSAQTSSEFCEGVNPSRHQEKCSSILIRDAILKRYGDITANCLYKSQSMRESLLEVVCNVVERLKNSVVTISEIKAMTLEVSDAANAKLDVSWLQQFFKDIVQEEETAKTTSDTRTRAILTVRAAQKEVEHVKIELETATINLRNAKRRVEVFKSVLEKIETDLLESVVQQKSWKKRLNDLLMSQG